MKKILFVFSIIMFTTVINLTAQPVFYTQAPFGVTTTQVRAPNGLSTYAYLRACALVLQTELTGISPTNNTITSFGFTLSAGANAPSTGNFTLYLQNTSDVNYSKGASWGTILTGMTQVYASTMTLPGTVTTTSITLTLSTPFVYTGGGIYVAYDWYSAGPYVTTPATYFALNGPLIPGCASAYSASSPPTTLGTTSFRPNFLFGTPNTFTNEIEENTVNAMGRLAGSLTTTNVVKANVRNNSGITKNNIPVSLNVIGANSFNNTVTVSSLASGASTTIAFPVMTPTNSGINTLSVSVPSDENNTNNSMTYTQSITCNEWALNPTNASYTIAQVGFNTGSGIVASTYSNPVSSTLTGIRSSVSTNTPSIGNQIWGVILDATGTVVATTNTLTITNGMLGTPVNFTFSSPPTLIANAVYYLGIGLPSNTNGYYPLGTYSANNVPFTNYVTTFTVGGTPLPFTTNLGYLDIVGVFAPKAQSISISSSTVTCGASVTLTNSALSYSWSGGPTNANFIVTPTTNTTYSLNYTDSYACANSATTNVAVNPITVNATGAATICSGSTVTLNASGGATSYTWSSVQSGASITVSPTVNTSYVVTGTTSAGCTNSAAVSVSVNARPTITVPNYTICSGNSLTIVPSGASTYTYSNGSATLAPNTSTNISVTGTGTNGCITLAPVISSVIVNTTPTITAISGSICVGQVYTISPSGANTYTIQGGSNTVTPGSTTSYTVRGLSTAGCLSQNIANVSVFVNPNPTITVNSGAICSGQTFTINPSGANTYTVQGGSNTVSPTSNTSYTVAGTSSAGCVSQLVAISNVTVNANPTIIVNSGAICSGKTFTISPSGANTYTVQGGSYTVSPTSNTSYTVAGTSSAGCVSQLVSTSNVTVNANPTITVNSGSICSGQTFTISPSGANTYTIQGGSNTVSPTSNTSYTVAGTSTAGCVSQLVATSNVTVNANPTITVNSGTICSGNVFTIAASGASTYTYSGGSNTVSPSSNTSYTVTGTSAEGCLSATAAISNVTVNPNPTVTATSNASVMCVGESATITANGATTYTWDGGTNNVSIVVTPSVSTSYTLNGTDAVGCSAKTVITQSVDACTNIKSELSNPSSNFKVYPNPSNGIVNVDISTSLNATEILNENAIIEILNPLGQVIATQNASKSRHVSFNINNYPAGVYFVKATVEGKTKTVKIIKE